jgi:hypothetical protein
MPKYKLLLGAALGKKWSEEEVLRPLEELSDAEVQAFQDYRRAVVEERSLDPLRVSGGSRRGRQWLVTGFAGRYPAKRQAKPDNRSTRCVGPTIARCVSYSCCAGAHRS